MKAALAIVGLCAAGSVCYGQAPDAASDGGAAEATPGMHRLRVAGTTLSYPYTVEVPSGWQVHQGDFLWLGPAEAVDFDRMTPDVVGITAGLAPLANPEQVAENLKRNLKGFRFAIVKEVGGVRGVLAEFEEVRGATTFTVYSLMLPTGSGSLQFIARTPRPNFLAYRAHYDHIFFSVRRASEDPGPTPSPLAAAPSAPPTLQANVPPPTCSPIIDEDRFSGRTTVYTKLMGKGLEDLSANLYVEYRADGAISQMSLARASQGWRYLRCYETFLLADGKRVQIARTSHSGDVLSGGYVMETILLSLPLGSVALLRQAQSIEVKICADEFTLPQLTVCAMRGVAEEVSHRNPSGKPAGN
jgi:hypothetical protein